MYGSNYSLFASCMIVSNCLCVVDWWSSIDGEQYVGDQGQSFDDKQEQQESFD